jgi:diguanylate cyclase (GGDEF)-like protein/PAS domain S-box-containing protein
VQPPVLANDDGASSPAQLRSALARAQALFEATPDGVLVVSPDGRVAAVNPAFCRLFLLGAGPSELIGLELGRLWERLHALFVDAAAFEARAKEAMGAEGAGRRQSWPLTDGRLLEFEVVPVGDDGSAPELLWLWRDVSDQARLRAVEALVRPVEQNLSLLDELTGLYNRRGFLGHARPQLDAAARLHRPMLLIFVDLDGLKPINDRLGHAAGDQALVDAAAVLRSTFRERDIIARLGGDEFVVLVTDASLVNPDGLLARLDQRIQAMNDRPHRPFVLAFSTGVSRFDPGTPETLEELLSQADRRMYREKRRRKLGEAH